MQLIKSGNSIRGIVGQPTPLVDIMGKSLFIGDLVRLFYFDEESKIKADHGLTYVADHSLNAFSDVKVSCDGVTKAFIMGIAKVKLGEIQPYGGYWHVKKVKRYSIKNRKGLFTPHEIVDVDMPESFMRDGY